MRRLSTGAVGAALLGLALLLVAAPGGSARGTARAAEGDVPAGRANIVKVSGLLDPALVDFVSGAIEDAEAQDALSVTLQLNSAGAVVSDAEIEALTEQMRESDVPRPPTRGRSWWSLPPTRAWRRAPASPVLAARP